MTESFLVVPYHGSAGYGYIQPWVKNSFPKSGYAAMPDYVMRASFTEERVKKG